MRPLEERGLAQATGGLHPSSCTYVQRHHKKYFNEFLHPFNPPAVVAEAMGGWRQHSGGAAAMVAAGHGQIPPTSNKRRLTVHGCRLYAQYVSPGLTLLLPATAGAEPQPMPGAQPSCVLPARRRGSNQTGDAQRRCNLAQPRNRLRDWGTLDGAG